MSEEWMKAAVWGLVTLAMLIVLWSSWRTYRADQAKLKKLQDFRERYDVEMTQLYRWFASDECALMVLDWLDRQLVGGDLRPDGSRRLEVAIHGLQELGMVPEGLRLVPVEPTPEMLRSCRGYGISDPRVMEMAWGRMLALSLIHI